MRAVLGQQVSVSAAHTTAASLSERLGAEIDDPNGSITRCFPTPAAIASADPATLPLPRVRREALQSIAGNIATGSLKLDAGADPSEALFFLLGVRGVGVWTASYIAMRALADPDVFLPGDSGIARALRQLGCPDDPASAIRLAESWRPWRSYATVHLWSSLTDQRLGQGRLRQAPQAAGTEGGRRARVRAR
jgi:AraC family transcriptional regulator of adaptative response / DNA-3-methyladenine glycosylase II